MVVGLRWRLLCEMTSADPMLDTASSKADPLLPITDAGNANVITYLRQGKRGCTAAERKRSEKI